MKIAFQGEEGSFTEEAIIKQFSDNCEKIACKEAKVYGETVSIRGKK